MAKRRTYYFMITKKGQAAMELEFLIGQSKTSESYTFTIDDERTPIEKNIAKSEIENRQLKISLFYDLRRYFLHFRRVKGPHRLCLDVPKRRQIY